MDNLPCLKCGATEGQLTLDVRDGDTLRCDQCNDEFTLADVEQTLAAWTAALPWLKSHPARTPCVAAK